MPAHRWERAGMGRVRVPANRRYGAQTARAVANFGVPRPGLALGDHGGLVRALLDLKRAAAQANARSGALDPARTELVVAACAEIRSLRSLRPDFPVHILHGGGGTSANMNVNEVVAHAANARGRLGTRSRRRVDPLEHVNRNQSTNDVYPSACRLALLRASSELTSLLVGSEGRWDALIARHGATPRLARTCLQDAVASDFAALFRPYAAVTVRCRERLERAVRRLQKLSLGGGLAGQPGATSAAYRAALAEAMPDAVGRDDLTLTADFADAAQNADDLLELAQALDALARVLVKQASDLRLLASGPEGGLSELLLAPLQPGSTALPGKVNPVVPEFVVQCGMQTIAAAGACGMATDHAELDLNVWEGVYVYNLSLALSLMSAAVEAWNERCLATLAVDEAVNRRRADAPAARTAALVQAHSYRHAERQLEARSRAKG
jgi:aspartate ammonia-lyase